MRKLVIIAIAAVLVAVSFTPAPAQASTMATISAFHATCTHFSVDVTVTGRTNDQEGWDRFRFLVTDGTGQTLYREDSARQVGATDRATVVNIPYMSGRQPARDPIRFSVIDLDILGRPVAVQQQIEINSACFAVASPTTRLIDLLPMGIEGPMLSDTLLYIEPGGAALELRVTRGHPFTALYRTFDNAWVALYVGGENLVWVRAETIDVDVTRLAVRPGRVDGSQQVTGAVIPGLPLATARMNFTLNFRIAPSINAPRIGRIPWQTLVPVYGRSADSQWILVQYNGLGGWVAARYVRLFDLPLSRLPVVG